MNDVTFIKSLPERVLRLQLRVATMKVNDQTCLGDTIKPAVITALAHFWWSCMTFAMRIAIGVPHVEQNVYTEWESILDSLSASELERLENDAILECALRGK
jgi:hypothetical protein